MRVRSRVALTAAPYSRSEPLAGATSRNRSRAVSVLGPQDFALLCHSLAVRIELAVDKRTTLETVRALLAGLTEDWHLHFYDRDYHSPSDPGSYVEVARRGDLFFYQRANHGWRGPWVKRRPEKMAQMIHQCRGYTDDYRDNQVYLVRKAPLTEEEIAAK